MDHSDEGLSRELEELEEAAREDRERDWRILQNQGVINRNLLRIGRMVELQGAQIMATKEQEDAIAAGVADLQNAETIEEATLTKLVTDLEAANAATPSPVLDSAIAAIAHVRDSIANFPGTLPSAAPPAGDTAPGG